MKCPNCIDGFVLVMRPLRWGAPYTATTCLLGVPRHRADAGGRSDEASEGLEKH
ncbi:hypothetical protein ACVWWO_000966 [Bradyrhizobium sp. F1.13.1]